MKRIAFFILAIISLNSCEQDFLDVKPKGELIPKFLEEYDLLLNSLTLETHSHLFFRLDEYYTPTNLSTQSNLVQNLYKFNDFYIEEDQNDPNWRNFYQNIFTVNSVIQGVQEFEDGPQKNRMIAEAKTQRAYQYFMLVNLYGKAYSETSASTDLGVPIYTEPELEPTLGRSSVQEVYDLMIEDLTTAIPFLPNEQSNAVRPSKAVAHGLLSRVYLYMGANYANEVVSNATQAIQINLSNTMGMDLYDYNIENYVTNPINNREQLFKKYNNSSFFLDGFLFPYQIIPEFANLFDSGDLRLDAWFRSFLGFYRPKDSRFGKGISTPELYLNRAEANFLLGNNTTAWNDLNYIRRHRLTTDDYVELSGPDVWDKIRAERAIELTLFDLNFFDIKRWTASGLITDDYVRYDWTSTGGVANKLEEVHRLSPNDENWALAIPRDIISEFNPNIEQNPRDGNN